MIQLFYVIKSDLQLENNGLLLASLLFSFYNISSKMITEDKIFFDKNWRSIQFNWFKHEYYCCCPCCHESTFRCCFNLRFFVRFIIRILDFMNRLSLLLILWVVVGGFVGMLTLC